MSQATSPGQQYHHMNAGAHRRPPPQIGAPALVWQRGYWMPEDEAQRRSQKRNDASPWTQCVDNALAHIFRSILSDKCVHDCTSPNYDPATDTLYLFDHRIVGLTEASFRLEAIPADEKSVRHIVFTARARYAGLWLTLAARVHHENFVILFALDFSAEVDETSVERSTLKDMKESFDALHELIITRYERGRGKGAKQHARGRFVDETYETDRPKSEELSKGLIGYFRRFVDSVCDHALSRPCNELPSNLIGVGDLFSDFMGIVYSLREQEGSLGFAFHPEDEGVLKMSAQVGGTDFGACGLDVLDAAWPVVTSSDCKSEIDRVHGDPEYVVATFNDRRTLYISSLGRLNAVAGQAPLIYTLIVSYPSPWRLGRFIDKLHTVGTLRLAALRDFHLINNASNEIDQLTRELATVTGGQSLAQSEQIAKQFAGIGEGMALGLSYRIARSRYYVNSFKDTVDSLRPDRVQGYQFYRDFIRSRVYDAFDYIDRVGARYDALKDEIEFRANLSRRQEARALQVATARQARAAASLLEAAEILSVIPLTYYGGYILHEFAEAVRHAGELPWLPTGSSPYYVAAFALSVVLAYGSRAFRHRRAERKKPRRLAASDQKP